MAGAEKSAHGMALDPNVPSGPLAEKWSRRRSELELLNVANRRKHQIIVVGTGLAGASAAAALGEMGYNVKSFCLQDSPRRAHSVAAMGGINAAKNYQNDGDTILRMFQDTIKGGDFRSREANCYRLAELSGQIIDHCAAQGVPFAREYGGHLANRSFGGAKVARTFYTRGETGQQLLLGAYQALSRQVAAGSVKLAPRTEMMDLVVVDGRARGIVSRHLVTGRIEAHAGHAVVLATGGYSNIYCLSTNAKASNVTALYRAYKRGACFANPCFTQIHPSCLPVGGDHQSKLTLVSEGFRNDARVWVPVERGDRRSPTEIPEAERDYFLERLYPSFGNLVARDVASRATKRICDEGYGVGETGLAVYLDFADAIRRFGAEVILNRYGNLFAVYERITGRDLLREPLPFYPAAHYTMGGLWVDYHLMSNLPGLFVLGEANFSDHGANRLGANSLLQCLTDGYLIAPYAIGHYLAAARPGAVATDAPELGAAVAAAEERIARLLALEGEKTVDSIHHELGRLLWDECGIVRNERGLRQALEAIPVLRHEFWHNSRVPGGGATLNAALEHAGRVADFLDMAELLCLDALARDESCGCHFREEHQTADHEARRNDEEFAYVAAWEYRGQGEAPALHREPLAFETVTPSRRDYKK